MMTEKMTLEKIQKAVAFGDSVTFGMSASRQENCWANLAISMLEQFAGHPIELMNKGICANILSVDTPAYEYCARPAGLQRLQQDVIDQKPDLVLIGFGLNDSRGGTSAQIFRRDYQRMIDQIRSQISPVIVALNLYYMHQEFYTSCEHWDQSNYEITEEYNLIIRQLAEKNGLLYADVYAAQQGVDWAVCPDHCHPNDLGHRLIANRVFEVIVRNLAPGR